MRVVTIGGYGFNEPSFLHTLKLADVDTFVDVRRRRGLRGSKYAFLNSSRLQELIAASGIRYFHALDLAPTKDIRSVQKSADEAAGTLKRDRTQLSEDFVERRYQSEILAKFDVTAFVKQLGDTRVLALFCVESEPCACHRSIAASYLSRLFVLERPVEHLSHEGLNRRPNKNAWLVQMHRRGHGIGNSVRLFSQRKKLGVFRAIQDWPEIWEIDLLDCPRQPRRMLKMFSSRATSASGLKKKPRDYLLARVDPWDGGIDEIYDGLVEYTGNHNGYISHSTGLPDRSTWFWTPDQDLELREDGTHYDYVDGFLPKGLSYKGEPEAPSSIPAGTLVRVSLADGGSRMISMI